MTRKITLTEHDLEGHYMDNLDCPMYRAIKRAGLPVSSVAGHWWTEENNMIHDFSPETFQLSHDLGVAQHIADEKIKFVGREFEIEY